MAIDKMRMGTPVMVMLDVVGWLSTPNPPKRPPIYRDNEVVGEIHAVGVEPVQGGHQGYALVKDFQLELAKYNIWAVIQTDRTYKFMAFDRKHVPASLPYTQRR